MTRGHLNKCPYMTSVPSSQVHFNVKVHFGLQKMQFRTSRQVSPRHRFYCIGDFHIFSYIGDFHIFSYNGDFYIFSYIGDFHIFSYNGDFHIFSYIGDFHIFSYNGDFHTFSYIGDLFSCTNSHYGSIKLQN